ncbi:peptidoglycan recognition protein family protein [Streptomyces specialis]|uniref:peptidoglycan recognition protein family protein n=1 Tax=Streptomyces specialis TaxID=498367 RepID=UPI00073E74D3|nr:peptidoglycan recognition protein [Streptomyces specialis]
MWSRRTALWAALTPLVAVLTWSAPPLTPPPVTGTPPRAEPGRPAVERTAPAPEIITRESWGADESLRREAVTYTGAARALFVHHTNHPDDYDCADVPAMLRAMQADHVLAKGWDDLGYNFVVDKCGRIYEGRAGGLDRFVMGAHTSGFNSDTVGVAVLGDYPEGREVPPELVTAIAKIAAWKLRAGTDPRGRVRLVSTNDAARVPAGEPAELDVISGHRDLVPTHCPGDALYAALPEIRAEAARTRMAGRR